MKSAEQAFEFNERNIHVSYRYRSSLGGTLMQGETDSFDIPGIADEDATCELYVEMGNDGFTLELPAPRVPEALRKIREYSEEIPAIEDETKKLDEELALWQDELRRSMQKEIPEVEGVGELKKKVEEIKDRKDQLLARADQLKAYMDDLKQSA